MNDKDKKLEETTMNKSNRKVLNGREKMEIVLEGLQSEGSVSEVCRRRGISPTLYYRWRDQLMKGAEEIFRNKRGRKNKKEERSQYEIERLRRVIAEVTAENLELKKNGWGDN